MKKIFTLILSVMLAMSLAGCSSSTSSSSEEGIYTAGTYTATAEGIGTVTVNVTVDATSITGVEIDASNETASIGGAAVEELTNQIMDAQSAEIDGVSGATVTSTAVKTAVNDCLAQAKGESVSTEKTAVVADGTYTGKAPSFGVMKEMELSVTFKDNEITDIETVCAGSATTYSEDEYSAIYATVEENLYPRIIETQSLATDSISGATISSNAAKTIIASIIDENGGNSSEWYTPVAKSEEVVKLEGYDVIVVGLGGSGVAAYLSAAQNGATVFGIETAAKLGGNATNTAGPLAVNPTAAVEANGGEKLVDETELYDAWMEYTDNDAKGDIVNLFIDESGKTLDWLTTDWDFAYAYGPTMFAFYDSHNWPLWTFYTSKTGTSKDDAFNNSMASAKALNEKNDYMTELTATSLILEDGNVVGVEAEYYDGTIYDIYGDSVILATGGYIGNAEMCVEYTGSVWHTKAMTQCDGFTIEQLLPLGAALYNPDVAVEDHIAALDTIIRDDDVSDYDKTVLTSLVNDTDDFEVVDSEGNPFDANYNGLGISFNAWEAGSNYYVLISEEQYESIKTNGLPTFCYNANGFLSQMDPETFDATAPVENLDDIMAIGQEWGDVYIADSVEDLSEQLGINVTSSIEGKVYCVKGAAYVYSTTGGLDIDTNINVLKEDGTPIENVYVVGNDSLGTLNESDKAYVTYGGCAQGWALTSGRLAGANAAAKYAE